MRRHRGQRWLGDRQAGAPRISAKLSYRREGERAPINGPIFDALAELIRTDHAAFIRHGIVQATGGSVREDLAQRMLERVPHDLLVSGWEVITREDEEFGDLLRQLDCPLLLAKHAGCLGSTEEGFEDAATAFPEARTVTVEDAPLTSEKFADAIRDFCRQTLSAAREKPGDGHSHGDSRPRGSKACDETPAPTRSEGEDRSRADSWSVLGNATGVSASRRTPAARPGRVPLAPLRGDASSHGKECLRSSPTRSGRGFSVGLRRTSAAACGRAQREMTRSPRSPRGEPRPRRGRR